MYSSMWSLEKNYRYNVEAKGVFVADKDDSPKVKRAKSQLSGKSISAIDNEFYNYLLELLNHASDYTIQERKDTINDITEYYYQQTERVMPNSMLTVLADILLDDILSNPKPDKSTDSEYPILSMRQQKRRRQRETGVERDTMDFLNNKFTHNHTDRKRTSEMPDNK